jgi:hypothetical protein
MKTAYELLMTAPDSQVKRCQIAHRAIAEGRWGDAAFTLRNAANEERGEWAAAAEELAEHCERKAA